MGYEKYIKNISVINMLGGDALADGSKSSGHDERPCSAEHLPEIQFHPYQGAIQGRL